MLAHTRSAASLSASVQLVLNYPHLIRSGRDHSPPLRPSRPFRLTVECMTVSKLSQGLSLSFQHVLCQLPQRGSPQRCNGAIARPRTRPSERAHAQARTGERRRERAA